LPWKPKKPLHDEPLGFFLVKYATEVVMPMTQAGLTLCLPCVCIFFASSGNNSAPNLLVVPLLKPKNPKSQRKSTTDENGQDLHHFVVPCNFCILQTDRAYQVLEPLQGINGAASPPFIVGYPLLSSPLRRNYYSIGKPTMITMVEILLDCF
jgi:hypothetical protein